jgi:hypothetical protein
MAKLKREEFIEKWEQKLSDLNDDVSIAFREDIADSILDEVEESEKENEEIARLTGEVERLSAELADSKKRYKDRFLQSAEIESKEEEISVEDEEPKEENIIDVKEI